MLGGQDLNAVHQIGLNTMSIMDGFVREIPKTYHEEGWKNTEVNNGEMRGDPVGEGELAHVRDMVDEIAYAMTDDGSKHGDERDENSGPVVDVCEE